MGDGTLAFDDEVAMTLPSCESCSSSLAIVYGVPADERLSHAPDAKSLDPHREMMFAVEPEKWMRLCGACADHLMATGKLAATFDLATWRDPRDGASRAAS